MKESGVRDTTLHLPLTSPLFANLDSSAYAVIVAHFTEEVLPAGYIVFHEHALGDTLYIIKTGAVRISKRLEQGDEQVLREMGRGEFFGEMGLLEERPRSAQVTTMTATTLLAMTRQDFNACIHEHPEVAISFLKAISAQLRLNYQQQAVLLQEKQALVEALAAQNAALERAMAELREAMATVAEHERVERDLEIAHEIQQQMLPATFPEVPGLSLHATTVPARWVGGDFYDAIRLEAHQVALLLGDVSGKGVPAAMQMARLMGEFRACVRHAAAPQQVMQALNALLCQRSLRFSSFITVQYLVLDVRQRQVQFICAGHPPILLRHANGHIECLGSVSNIPLGIDDTFLYGQEARQLAPGDTLLLYSDGAYERYNGQGGQLGLPHFTRLFAAAPASPLEVVQTLQTTLDAFSEVVGAGDDTTLLCAQVA
jgi:serine phosphatase RsbU (regulator of sigma subunit)